MVEDAIKHESQTHKSKASDAQISGELYDYLERRANFRTIGSFEFGCRGGRSYLQLSSNAYWFFKGDRLDDGERKDHYRRAARIANLISDPRERYPISHKVTAAISMSAAQS